MIYRLVLLCALAVGALVAAPAAAPALHAQETHVRFEIADAGDTTFTFQLGGQEWVKRGQRGIAVDPRRRDALVARFRVVRIQQGVATAVITGQTMRVATDHIALIDRPRRRWWQQPTFWGGAVAGAIVGVITGAAL